MGDSASEPARAAAFQPLGLLICHSFSLGGLNER